jgi:succinate dehydrogenase / fumarate reductase membrane anchor subunit
MTEHKTIQRTAYGVVAGLGSGKSGTHHWWHQRITSVAMIFLGLWLVYAFVFQVPTDYQGAIMWIKFPIHAVLLMLTIFVGLYHGALGLQVIIEDYLHTPWIKLFKLYAMKFLSVILAIGSVFALIKIMYIQAI